MRTPSSPRKWRRNVLLALLALFLLVAVGVLLPWSPPGLRRALERMSSRRLGCAVRIGRATIWPVRGLVTVRDLEIDCSSGPERLRHLLRNAPIWGVDKLAFRFRPDRFLSRKRPVDITVTVENADPVIAMHDGDRLTILPPLDRLARPAARSRWRVAAATLTNGAVEFLLNRSKRQAAKRIILSLARTQYQNADGAYQTISVSGQAGLAANSIFRSWLIHRGNVWKLRLVTDPFRFSLPNVHPDLREGFVQSGEVNAKLAHSKAGRWTLEVGARSPRIEFSDIVEIGTSSTLVGSFDSRTSQGAISFDIASRDTRLGAVLDLSLADRTDSRTTITIERLAQGWYRLWNRRHPPQFPVFEDSDARLEVSAAARLLPRSPWIERPRARVTLSGADLSAEYLPLTIRDVGLDAEFQPHRITLHDCSGKWSRGWARFSGIHQGPWLSRIEGTTRFDWAFALRAEDLVTTLPAAAENALPVSAVAAYSHRPAFEGDLAGTGTLRLAWAPSAEFGPPTTRTLEGVVTLRRGRIAHPKLPGPITDINGTFELSPQRLEIRNVRGKFLETTATIRATIEGQPYFWIKPTARCRVQTQFPIQRAMRYVSEPYRDRLETLQPSGTILALAELAGPLRRPFRDEDIATSAVFLLRDGAFQSTFYGLEGRFHDVEMRAAFDGNTVRLTTATGRIENVPFSLTGEADLEAGRIWTRLESSAPLAAYQAVLPRALSRYEVGGSTSGWLRLEAWGKDLFKQAVRIRSLTSETLSSLPFHWKLTGEIEAHDAELTFETYPTSVTAINGRVRLDNFNWTFVDMTSSWGKTHNCKIGGGGRFRPGSWPKMHIDLEAPVLYLDEWIRPWRRSRGSRFKPRVENPVFELSGTIRGKRAFYRGHPGKNVYAEIGLVSRYGGVDVFRYDNARADLYGGRVTSKGEIAFRQGRSTTTLEFTARNISLPPLLQCESGREQTFVGRMSGQATFHWRDMDVDTLTGSGRIRIDNSRFFGNVFFRNLARLIKIPYLDNVSFAQIEAPIRFRGRKVFCDRLDMQGPLIAMKGKGVTGFDHSVDFILELGFSRLPGYARLLDLVVQYFGKVPSTVFSLDLRGTWDNPQFSFHQLGVAEKGFLGAIEQIWGAVTP